MRPRELLTGNLYTYDTCGVTDRLNVIGAVPYIWTKPSGGVLHGSQGLQDLSLGAKYRVFQASRAGFGTLRGFAVGSAGIPMTDYNIELLPLSIGTRSRQVSARGTLNYQSEPGWFVNGTVAYSWRSETELDRPYFYRTASSP